MFPSFGRKKLSTELMIADLVTRFEKGSLSRRDLVQGLALLAASGTTAAAQSDEIDFRTANIDHVSMQVANVQRSVDFYQKTFGFSFVSEDKPLGIVRLGNGRTLVSFNGQSPTGIVDHFSIGVPRFTKEAATRYFAQRGLQTADDPYHGLHVKDPDGIHVQVSGQR
jgi:catechol 2,3-dioxygenase-like lactoylglutathione lyase family enzyme